MKPFDINYNQLITCLKAEIIYQSKFCIYFSVQRNHFILYRISTAAPLYCMHIPSGKNYPPYQVFYFCSEFLSLSAFLEHNQMESLPDLPEIDSITETISANDILAFAIGLIDPRGKDTSHLPPEIDHLLGIALSCKEVLDFDLPVFLNKENSLSFLLSSAVNNIPDSFQICDFTHNQYSARYANNGGAWISPYFAHQNKALISYSPVTFLQYFSQNSLTDERAFVFSPEFSQTDIYNHFFPFFNDNRMSEVILLFSNDMRELLNNISFFIYCFNYFSLLKASLSVSGNSLEITFFYHRKHDLSMPMTRFFNGIRARMRKILLISPNDEIDDDFFRLFKPFTAADNSRYPNPDTIPDNAMDEAFVSMSLKMESLLAVLQELPILFKFAFDSENSKKLDIRTLNPFVQFEPYD